MNVKIDGRQNFGKHREIKGSDKYVTLDILLKFDTREKMIIKSSGSKVKSGISGKGLITSLSLKSKTSPKKYKKSIIVREFEILPYESYGKKRPEHEPTDSYFYLAGQLANFMMRANSFNLHVYSVRTEINATKNIPVLHVCSMYNSELKYFLVEKTLSKVWYTDKGK